MSRRAGKGGLGSVNPKATTDLAQLSDEDLFYQVATGLGLIFESATTLDADATGLAEQGRYRGARILRGIAEEEAAKFLILLDAVRCPRNDNSSKERSARQLGACNEHLAKGIYTEYYWGFPSTFHEVRGWVNQLRQEYCIDGPEYTSWVFRNRILDRRESQMYVSYVRYDTGHAWETSNPILSDCAPPLSRMLGLIRAMNRCGFISANAIRQIANLWRPVQMTDNFDMSDMKDVNAQTLKAIKQMGFRTVEDCTAIEEGWYFPLYDLDLGREQVKLASLQSIQKLESDRFGEQFV
jgi:AbiV family abortive infection protein